MVTKEQALTETHFHYGTCTRTIGSRGAVLDTVCSWRRNGDTKTWKTRPEEFKVPLKYGLYDYGYLDQRNAGAFHVPSDCPLAKMDNK